MAKQKDKNVKIENTSLPTFFSLIQEPKELKNSPSLDNNGNIGNTQIGSTNFGESNYDKTYSSNISDIQSGDYLKQRGEQQSGLTQIGAGILRAGSKAVIEAVKTPAYIYALGEWGASNVFGEGETLDKALDNSMLNALENVDDKIKQDYLPVYKTFKATNGNFLDQIITTSFIGTDVADGVGYLLGMIAPGAAIKSLGLAPKLTKLGISTGVVSNIDKATKLGNAVELGTQTLINTAVESLAEAKGVSDRLKTEFEDMLNPNSQNYNPINPETKQNWTKEDINKHIADATKETFTANVGILLLPNLIMNKNLLGRFNKDKSILDKYFTDAAGKLQPVSKIAAKQQIKQYSKKILTGIGSEGFLEEGGQSSVENYEVNKGLSKTDKGFLQGVADEYLNTLTTTEGQKSIFIGGLLGSIGGASGQFKEFKNDKKRFAPLSELISGNFEGFSADTDIFQRDDKGEIVYNKDTKKPVIDNDKKNKAIVNYLNEVVDSQKADVALQLDDKTLYDHINNQSFARQAFPYFKEGETGLEILKSKINDASYTRGIIDNEEHSTDETKHKADLIKKSEDLFKIYNSTDKFVSRLPFLSNLQDLLPEGQDASILNDYINKVTNSLYQETNKQVFYKHKINELNLENTKLAGTDTGFSELPQNQIDIENNKKDIESLSKLLEKSKEIFKSALDIKQHEIAFKDFIGQEEELKQDLTENKPTENSTNNEPLTNTQTKKNSTEDDTKIAQAKDEYHSMLTHALESESSDELGSFEGLLEGNPFYTNEDKKAVALKHKEIQSNDIANSIDGQSTAKEINIAKEKLNALNKENEKIINNVPHSEFTEKEQEEISNYIDNNTDSKTIAEEQNIPKQDNSYLSQKSLAKVVNVVMMKLFGSYFKDGKFKFEKTDEGFPKLENNSNLDITEINNIKEGDIVEFELVELNEKQLESYLNTKNNSLKEGKDYIKSTDFDDKHIGIYSNGKLIGFVQQPHSINSDITDFTEALKLRESLIAYRKTIVSKLENNEKVIETVDNKSTGNLYTKTKEVKGEIKVNADSNVFENARPKDIINGISLFVYSNGKELVLKNTSLSAKQIEDEKIDESLNELNSKITQVNGQPFKLVRDLTSKWSVIPLYTKTIQDSNTKVITNGIMSLIDSYNDNTDILQIINELSDFVYTSRKNTEAPIHVSNYKGVIEFKIDGDTFTLNELQNNKIKKGEFINALQTKRQNINMSKINNVNYQKQLADRNALFTNAYTFNGEYYVQPYISYTQTLNAATVDLNSSEAIKEYEQLNETKPKSESTIDFDAIKKKFDLDNTEDDVLSINKDFTELDRTKFKNWLKNKLPQLKLSDVEDIRDLKTNIVDAYGMFKNLTIYLFNGAGNKTAYHEAFHGVFRNLLSDSERYALIQEAIEKYPEPTAEDLIELQDSLDKIYTPLELKYLYYEEKLADDFAEYTNTINSKSFLSKLGSKITEFFNKILKFFGLFEQDNNGLIKDLFDKVNKGEFKNSKITNDKFKIINKEFQIFKDENAYSKVIREKLGASTKSKIFSSIANEFLNLTKEANYSGKPQQPVITYSIIFNKFEKYLENLQKATNFDNFKKIDIKIAVTILENKASVINEVNKLLASMNLIVNAEAVIDKSSLSEDRDPQGINDPEILEMRSKESKGFNENTTFSGLSSATKRIKLFLSSIPVLIKNDKNQNVKKLDSFGFKEYYDFTKIYHKIENELIDLYSVEEQLDKLKDLSEFSPEMLQVLDRLGYKIENNKVVEGLSSINKKELTQIRNDFKTNFSKQQLPFTLIKYDMDSTTGKVVYTIMDANRQTISLQVQSEWENNLVDSTKNTISEVNNEGEIIKYGTVKSKQLNEYWLKYKAETEKVKGKFDYDNLNKILVKAGIEFNKKVLVKLINKNSTQFKSNISKVLNWYASNDPQSVEKSGKDALRELVKYETNSIFNSYTTSFNDVENKNIFSIQLPSFISKKLAKLKNENWDKYQAELNEYLKDSFYKNSNILTDFIDNDDYRLNDFRITYLDGLKNNKNNDEGVKFVNMNDKDFLNMQFALFQNTYANKNRVNKVQIMKHIYITPSDKSLSVIADIRKYYTVLDMQDGGIDINSEIVSKYYNLFLSETERIKHNLSIKNDILLNGNNSQYRLDELLQYYHASNNDYKRLQNYIFKQNNNEEINEKDWERIGKLLDRGQAFRSNYFDIENILDLTKEEALIAIKKEIDIEFKNTIDELLNKSIITKNKEGKLESNSIDVLQEDLYKTILSFSANTKLANIELSNLFNGDVALYKPDDLQKRTYQSQAMTTNNNFNRKVNVIVKKDYKYNENVDIFKDMLTSLGLSQDKIQDLFKDYNNNDSENPKINVTDATVYVTPNFYKEFLEGRGVWDNTLQEAYDILEENKNSKKIDASLYKLMAAIKPFYFGNRFDEKLGIMRYEQVKTMFFPLFKAFTNNNPLMKEKLDDLNDMGGDMIAFESSFKGTIGFRSSIDSNEDLYLQLDGNNFGVQTDNPIHESDDDNDGTRQIKMLLVGSIDKNKTYNGKSGQNIIDEIMQMESENISESLDDLKKKFDVKNNAEFAAFIKDSLTRRGATINTEEALNIVNGEFEYALDSGNLSTQIENLICSLYTNKVVKQPFKGGALVQVTSLGFKHKNFKNQQTEINNNEKLSKIQSSLKWIRPSKNGNKLEYAEAVLPSWTNKFFNEDGFLKDINDIPDNLKQLVIYRIPTEGVHSMLPIKVVQFLPEAMGSFIILPEVVTAQFGADFDFDKMFFINKEFYISKNSEGNEIYNEYQYIEGETKEDTNKRFEQYKKYTPKSKQLNYEEFSKLPIKKQNVTGARNNSIINNYLTLLTSKENLPLMLRASGFTVLDNIKNKYFKNDGFTKSSDFFSSRIQRDFKSRNHISRALKGLLALHVSGHSYSTLTNLSTKNEIMFNKLDNSNQFNKLYNVDGNLISDDIASVMAAALDDIKKPILQALNITVNTANIICAILRNGQSLETAIKFVAQDSIKEYDNFQTLNRSKIKKNKDVTNIDNQINSYLKLLNQRAKQLLDNKENVNTTLIDVINLGKKAGESEYSSNINDSELEYYLSDYKNITNKSNEDLIRYYSFQLRVLRNFKNIKNIADELTQLNKFFAINKEVGPNIEDILAQQSRLETIEISETLTGFNLDDIPTLKATWNAHLHALEFFKKYFPYNSDLYSQIKETLMYKQSNKPLYTVDTKDKMYINSFIRYFLDNKSKTFEEVQNQYDKNYYSTPILIKAIKNSENSNSKLNNISYENIKNNLFIEQLVSDFDKQNGTYYLRLKANRLDLNVKNNIIESFQSLYENSNTKQLAIDIIEHSFVNSGFFTSLNSYGTLLSPEILKDLGYNEYRKDTIKKLNNDDYEYTPFDVDLIINQLIRNDGKKFTSVYEAELFGIEKGKPLPKILNTSENRIKEHEGKKDLILENETENNPIRLIEYIRVYDSVNKKALFYINTPGTYTYTYISGLGSKKYGVEVNTNEHIEKSYFKQNNTLDNIKKDVSLNPINTANKKNTEDLSINEQTFESMDNTESSIPEDFYENISQDELDYLTDKFEEDLQNRIDNDLPSLPLGTVVNKDKPELPNDITKCK